MPVATGRGTRVTEDLPTHGKSRLAKGGRGAITTKSERLSCVDRNLPPFPYCFLAFRMAQFIIVDLTIVEFSVTQHVF